MPKTDYSIVCKNIFKDGKNITSKDKFTGAWINLINQLEKDKANICSPKSQASSKYQ